VNPAALRGDQSKHINPKLWSDADVSHLTLRQEIPNSAEQRRGFMRHILLTAALGLALGATGAIAQTAAPVPNASGSQTTNPNTYGDTKSPGATMPMQGQAGTTGNCAPVPNASGSQRTNPCDYGSTANAPGAQQGTVSGPAATGSVAPVPNASGSQTTNPATYGDTKKP
jgi:hypothetical protein